MLSLVTFLWLLITFWCLLVGITPSQKRCQWAMIRPAYAEALPTSHSSSKYSFQSTLHRVPTFPCIFGAVANFLNPSYYPASRRLARCTGTSRSRKAKKLYRLLTRPEPKMFPSTSAPLNCAQCRHSPQALLTMPMWSGWLCLVCFSECRSAFWVSYCIVWGPIGCINEKKLPEEAHSRDRMTNKQVSYTSASLVLALC